MLNYKVYMVLQQPVLDVADGPGRRLRKNVANVRRHIDYIANVLNHFEVRLHKINSMLIVTKLTVMTYSLGTLGLKLYVGLLLVTLL